MTIIIARRYFSFKADRADTDRQVDGRTDIQMGQTCRVTKEDGQKDGQPDTNGRTEAGKQR